MCSEKQLKYQDILKGCNSCKRPATMARTYSSACPQQRAGPWPARQGKLQTVKMRLPKKQDKVNSAQVHWLYHQPELSHQHHIFLDTVVEEVGMTHASAGIALQC